MRQAGRWRVDGILQAQSTADSDYLLKVVGIEAAGEQPMRLPETLSKAYRWQYIVSGAIHPHF